MQGQRRPLHPAANRALDACGGEVGGGKGTAATAAARDHSRAAHGGATGTPVFFVIISRLVVS